MGRKRIKGKEIREKSEGYLKRERRLKTRYEFACCEMRENISVEINELMVLLSLIPRLPLSEFLFLLFYF